MRRLRIEGVWRGSGLLLVLLALAVRLATPDGWMLAPGDGHGGPQMVICNGHMGGGAGMPGHPDKSDHSDHPCVFAGAHVATAPALLVASLVATSVVVSAEPPARLADQRPGRGLAAPPPPSQGPPAALI
ncbi:MAG TPA: DUF2946 family protein [Phenylobacterium sp.]|jgi:hypothetical protein|nr:DUF2946 family protein [Phenylobacterium sp.]